MTTLYHVYRLSLCWTHIIVIDLGCTLQNKQQGLIKSNLAAKHNSVSVSLFPAWQFPLSRRKICSSDI